MKYNILHFSDTHNKHREFILPNNIDIAIFSGDCSNPMDPYKNEAEVRDFIKWYGSLDIKYKIFVAGNHDSSIEKRLISKFDFAAEGIIYLENDFTEIDGIKIWGSPITPTFGNWSFMKNRAKLHDLWQTIPEDTDIIVVHGPPQGVLDLSCNRENQFEMCGCKALTKRVKQIEPKYCMFGHIHNGDDVINTGTRTFVDHKTVYSNGSCITDRQFHKGLTSFGNVFEYEIK